MKPGIARLPAVVLALAAGIVAPGGADRIKPAEYSRDVPKAVREEHIGHIPSDVSRIEIAVEPTRAESFRSGFFGLGTALKSLILLPLLLLGRVLLFAVKRVFRISAGPVLGFLLECAFFAALLAGLFALVWKLLFPGRPLRDLFRGKRLLWLFGTACALTCALRFIRLFERHRLLAELLFAGIAFGLLCLLTRQLFKNVPPPERERKWIELPRL